MAPRKCTRARRAGEGAGRGGHSPAWPRPGGPGDALGPRGRGRAGLRGVLRPRPGARPSSRPPSSSAPSTWGPGRPATWGNSSARGPWRSAPGWPWLRRAPRQARGADLPLSRPRGSNFLPGPSASRFCLLRPAGLGAGRPQGALALPKSGSGRRLPAPGPRGGGWLWVRAEGARCAGTRSGCVPYEKQNIFYTLKKKKNVPSCCLVLAGAIFKALPLGGSSGTRGTEALCGWVHPPSPSPRVGDLGSCAVPGPRGWCLDTKPGIQAERRLQLHPTPVARGFGARFAGGTPRCGLGGLFSLRPRSPPTLIFRPQDRPRVLRGPPVWAERSPSSRSV